MEQPPLVQLTYTLVLTNDSLELNLTTQNNDKEGEFPIHFALHTYYNVNNIDDCRIFDLE